MTPGAGRVVQEGAQVAELPEMPSFPWRTAAKKPAKARVPITQDQIVETAIRVLDAEGLDAVSMRRVAQELDTGAASLYAHVANKKELLDLVFDRIVGEMELPPIPADPREWREAVRALGIGMHATLSAHADVARVALANIPLGPNALRISERMLAVMVAGGVPAQAAAWFLDRMSLYIVAEAYEGTLWDLPENFDPSDRDAFVEPLRQYFRSLPVEHFPSLVAHVDEMTTGDKDERFLFGLDLLLDGLAARITP
jgi:AcrR family transcriptional regulator